MIKRKTKNYSLIPENGEYFYILAVKCSQEKLLKLKEIHEALPKE